MKNLNLNFNDSESAIKDVSFRDVVIIGNGPSGISLSFFLAGNWPYWKPELIESHPDELLKARLTHLDSSKSLIEHDLFELTQGLEGRSTNPFSLLLDSLQNPGADLGLNLPCMLKYKHHPEKEIDHVVLGKGPPGGSWHRMDPNLRTLSLSSWMSLPNLNFDDWEREFKRHCSDNDSDCHSLDDDSDQAADKASTSDEVKTRALVSSVAEYYENYVHLMSLDKFFRNDTIVVAIRQIKEAEAEKYNNSKLENARWIVHGFDRVSQKPFIIGCRKVVLANGGSDLVNRLGVRGENKSLSWLKYELPLLEKAIENVAVEQKSKTKVMIVGNGLSAADAVIACRKAGIEVVHVFRSVNGGFVGLPQTYFPEYNNVFNMIRNPSTKHDFYTPIPESTLKEIKSSGGRHFVTVQNLRNSEITKTFEVTYCAILIGSRPDLSLLQNLNSLAAKNHTFTATPPIDSSPENLAIQFKKFVSCKLIEKCRHLTCFGIKSRNSLISNLIEDANDKQKICRCDLSKTKRLARGDDGGLGFGEDPAKPVDCKTNPLAVNKYTNELLQVPNCYSLGPLVGDNFVRFIAGGALAIARDFSIHGLRV